MGVGILAKRVVLELGSSTNFVYSLNWGRGIFKNPPSPIDIRTSFSRILGRSNNTILQALPPGTWEREIPYLDRFPERCSCIG